MKAHHGPTGLRSVFRLVALLVSPSFLHAQEARGIADLRHQIAAALSSGLPQAVIQPGVYRGSVNENVFITIRDAGNLLLDATGVTLICEKRTRAVEIINCENFHLRGLTVDYDPLPFTQGTITAVDAGDKWVDVRIHEGYPVVAYPRIDQVDPQTRHRKYGMPFLWGTTAELRPGGMVRVSRADGFGGAFTTGDLASLSEGPEAGGVPHGITIEGSRQVTLENVSLHAAPGFGIICGPGHGDDHYDNVRVVPGPKPSGASEERLLSTSWDAVQFNNLRKGPVMENCIIKSAGDDSWSLSSRDYLLLAVDGATAWLVHRVPYQSPLQAGDRLARSLDGPKPAISEILPGFVPVDNCPMSSELRTRIESANPYEFYDFELGRIQRIELDAPCPWEAGTSLYSPDRNCSGFVLRNNVFHSSGRAGLINGASNGVIEGNEYTDVHAALSLYPEVPAGAASRTENIVFRNNRIHGSNHFAPAPWSLRGGAVNVCKEGPNRQPAPAGEFRNIVIENNLFQNVRGPVFVITSTTDVVVAGNKLMDCQQHEPLNTGEVWGVDNRSLGWFKRNSNLAVHNNEIINRGGFGTRGPFTFVEVNPVSLGVVESFRYNTGPLHGNSPPQGFGLSGTWTDISSGMRIAAGSPAAPAGYGFTSAGGHLISSNGQMASSRINLAAESVIDLDADRTTYLSYLYNAGGGNPEFQLRLMSDGNPVAWIGDPQLGNLLTVKTASEASGTAWPANQTVLVVVKIQSAGSGNDSIQSSFFTQSIAGEPVSWDVSASAGLTGRIDQLELSASTTGANGILFDELRAGPTFASVVQGTAAARSDADGDGLDDAWEMRHFPDDHIDGTGDHDGDGIRDFFEYIFGSDPKDGASRGSSFRVAPPDPGSGYVIEWQVKEGFRAESDYRIRSSSDLIAWNPLPSGLFGLIEHTEDGMTRMELRLSPALPGSVWFIRLQSP